MRAETALNDAVERAKREILEDIVSMRVPSNIASFSELHDFVDANEYGGLCDPDAYGDESTDFVIDVQDAVDAWIRAGVRSQEGMT